jgi:hypothetical protein
MATGPRGCSYFWASTNSRGEIVKTVTRCKFVDLVQHQTLLPPTHSLDLTAHYFLQVWLLMAIGERSIVSHLSWFLFLNERRPRFLCSVGFWLQFLFILSIAIYLDRRTSVICSLFGLWGFQRAIIGSCTSHIDEPS